MSSLHYRDTEKSLREVGEELGVETLLMGKIRRQGNEVRVNVELVEARSSQNLWADVFDRPMSDIFAIQSEIAESLADKLKLELSAETERALEQAPTVDPEAYQLVLRARFQRNRETRESFLKAVEYFERATERDPDYALAWAGLAETQDWLVYGDPPELRPERRKKVVRALEKALALDEGLAEAHVSKGLVLKNHPPHDDVGAERELRRAIELNPRLALAHRELGLLLFRHMGRIEEGLAVLIDADDLEPLFWLTKQNAAEAYTAKGDLVSAVETLREVQELGSSPDHELLPVQICLILQDLEEAERRLKQLPDSGASPRLFSLVSSLNGRSGEAAAARARLLKGDVDSTRIQGVAGIVALFAGESQSAVRPLEQALKLNGGKPVAALVPQAPSRLYSDSATLLGYAHLKLGDQERAFRLFEQTEQYYSSRIARGDTSFQARVGLAAVHLLRGDKDAAYRWLQEAIDAGFFAYAELERFFVFESLHGEERFQRMMDGVEAKVADARRRVDSLEAKQ